MSLDSHGNRLDRRRLLHGAASLGLSAFLPISQVQATPYQSDLVRTENERPGTTDWQLINVRIDQESRYRSSSIEGYGQYKPGVAVSD